LNDFFLIGKIKSVANEKGELNLMPFSDFLDRYKALDSVLIDVFGGFREFFVEFVIVSEKSITMKFRNFDSREDVNFLVGRKIFIPSAESIALDEESFFIHDLVNCKVFRNGAFFGEVIEILNLPANDVLVIKKGNEEILIPFIDDYVADVNAEKKRIDLIEGSEDLFND
jgi:16S rRNA processing protein RimM